MADTTSTGNTTPTVDQATPSDTASAQSTGETVQLAAAVAAVEVSAPARGAEASLTVEPGQTVELKDPVARYTQDGSDLVIHWANGAHTTLVDGLGAGTPLILADGTPLSPEQVIAQIEGFDPGAIEAAAAAVEPAVEPAAGAVAGRAAGGAFNTPPDLGTLGPEADVTNLLLGTELQFGVPAALPELAGDTLNLNLNFITVTDKAAFVGGFEDWQPDQNVGDFDEFPMRLDISGSGPIASVVISGIPFDVEVFIGDPFGTAEPTPASGTYSVAVDAADFDSIFFRPPDDSDVDFDVTVTATGFNSVVTSASVTAVVDAVADLPDVGFSGDGIVKGGDEQTMTFDGGTFGSVGGDGTYTEGGLTVTGMWTAHTGHLHISDLDSDGSDDLYQHRDASQTGSDDQFDVFTAADGTSTITLVSFEAATDGTVLWTSSSGATFEVTMTAGTTIFFPAGFSGVDSVRYDKVSGPPGNVGIESVDYSIGGGGGGVGELYGLSSDTGGLYRIDPATGAASFITDIDGGDLGASLTGLSFLNGKLFGTDIFDLFGSSLPSDLNIGTLNIPDGAFAFINDQDGSSNWHGLATDETNNLLYTIDLGDNDILKSMTADGTVTSIGTGTGIDGRGMAFDDTNGILYATDRSDQLFTVDTTTGVATLVGSTGLSGSVIGLAYDENTNTLFANDGDSNSLYILDTGTGAATLVGDNFVDGIDGLAWLGSIGGGGAHGDVGSMSFNVTYNEDNAFGEGGEGACLTDHDPVFGAGFTAAVTDIDGSEHIKTIVVIAPREAIGDPALPDNPVDSIGLRDPLSGVDDPTATNFLIGGVVVTDETIVSEDVVDTIVQVYATFFAIDAAGNVLSGVPVTGGLVDAHVNFVGNAMTLDFEMDGDGSPLNAGIQIQSVFLDGSTLPGDEALATTFEVRLPQHSDDDFQLQLNVTVTENPPTDQELTLANNEATQVSFLNVEVQAVADEAVINFNPHVVQFDQFINQVFDFVEDGTTIVPAHEDPNPPLDPDPPIVPPAHGDSIHELPLQIPLTFVAEITDVDGSESITEIKVTLNGADPGAKFIDETGADLATGTPTVIDGVSFDVDITGQILTLTANPPVPAMDINVGGEVQIQLPIDDSTDFSATFDVTTTETNAEGDAAHASCTVTATRAFNIEGVVGPADTDNGFAAYSDGGEGGDPGFVSSSPTAPSVVIDFETLAHDGTVVSIGDPYNEDGFTLNNINAEGSDFFVVGSADPRNFGSASLGNSFPNDTTQLMREGGGEFKTFNLESIDLAENELPGQPNVTFTGFLAAGGTVQQTFTLDGIPGGETFNFNPGFSDLISVSWDQGESSSAHIFDNIVVQPVVNGLVSFVEDAQPDPLQHGDNAGESNLLIALHYNAATQDDDGTGALAAPDSANERNSEGVTQLVVSLDGADPGDMFVKADGSALNGDGSIVLGDGLGGVVNGTYVLSGPDGHTLTITFADPGVQTVHLDGGGGLDVKLPIDDSTDFRVNFDVTTTEWDDDNFDGAGNFLNNGSAVAVATTVVHDDINFEIQGVVGPADTDTNVGDYSADTGFVGFLGGGGPVVIDFETLDHTGINFTFIGDPYNEDGFELNNISIDSPSADFLVVGSSGFVNFGSASLGNNETGGTTELTQEGGGPFDLISIDLSEFSNIVFGVTFTGNLFGGGTVMQTFTLDGVRGGSGETFNFNTDFTNLASVTWDQGVGSESHLFDNIVVSSGTGVSFVEDGESNPANHGPNADETNLLVNLRYEAHTQDDDGTGTPAPSDSASERNSEGITQMVVTLNDADPGDVFVKADGSALNGDGSIQLGDGLGGVINGTYVLSGPDGQTLTITFANPGIQDVDLFDLAGGEGLSVELPIDDSTDFSVTYDTTTTEWDDDNFDAAGTFFDNGSAVFVAQTVTTDTIEFEIQGQVGPADTAFGDYAGEAAAMFAAPVDDGSGLLTLRFFEDGDADSLIDPALGGVDGNRAGPLVVQIEMTATAQDDDGTGTPAANNEVNERNSEAVTEIQITLTDADAGAFFTSGGTALGASGILDLGLGSGNNPDFALSGNILTLTFQDMGVQSVDLAGGDGIAVQVPMHSDTDFQIDIVTTTTEYDDDTGGTVHAPPTTTATDTIAVVVDAVADIPHVILDVNDGGGDTDSEFSPNEIGIVSVNVDFGDVTDGSETHTVTVDLPAGFAVSGGFPGLPAGVSASIVGGDVEFTAATGVSGFNYVFNVQAPGSIPDNTSFPFTGTAQAVETPTDPATEGTFIPDNNIAVHIDPENVPGSSAGVPAVGFSLDGDAFLKEDTSATATITAATTSVGDTITEIEIAAPAGWMLGATVGGDISGISGGGTNVLTLTVDADGSSDFFPNVTSFSELITVQAPLNSDVDGALTVTATAVDGFDTVTGTGASPFDVTVDAVVDGSEVTQAGIAAGDEGTVIDMNLAIALGGDSTSLTGTTNPDPDQAATQGGTDTDGSELVTEVVATLSGDVPPSSSTVLDFTLPGSVGAPTFDSGANSWTFDTSGATTSDVEDLVASFGVDTTGLDVGIGGGTIDVNVVTTTVDTPTDVEPDTTDNVDVDTYDFTVNVFDTNPNVLNGFINTNSSVAGQELRLTLTEANNSANAFAAILTLQLVGDQAQAIINLDAGFAVDPGTEYVATLDWVGAGGSGIDFIEITQFDLEDVTIVGGGSGSVTIGTDEPVSDDGLTAVIDPETALVAGPAPFDPGEFDNRVYGDGMDFTAVPAVAGVDATDALFGGVADDDVLFGGDGADTLYGDVTDIGGLSTFTGGDDMLIGGAGLDSLFGDAEDLSGFAQVTGGGDILLGGDGADALYGDVRDIAGNAILTGGNDALLGGGGNDTLYGDAGSVDDFGTLIGGDDTLNGGAGDDHLFGDVETIIGGSTTVTGGADTFVYESVGDGDDTIGDFDHTQGDVVNLDTLFDALGAGSGDARAARVDISSDVLTIDSDTGTAGNQPFAGFSITFDGAGGGLDGALGSFTAAQLAALGIDVGA